MSLKLCVQTFNLKTGQMENQKYIDHDDFEDRKWLGRHCFWAFRNDREIRTFRFTSKP